MRFKLYKGALNVVIFIDFMACALRCLSSHLFAWDISNSHPNSCAASGRLTNVSPIFLAIRLRHE
jgi:hypothetical protein